MKRLCRALFGWVVLLLFLLAFVAEASTRQFCPYLDGALRPVYHVELGILHDVRTENRGPVYSQMELKTGADLAYFHDIAFGDIDLRMRFDHVIPLRKAAFSAPDHLMALVLEMHWFWRFVNNTAFALQFDPGVYASTEDLFDMPLGLPIRGAGIYTFDRHLAWVAGLQVRPSFHHLFVPYGGIVWHPYPQLRLDATVPEARVTFYLDREWSGFAGWSWESTTYHVKPDTIGRNRLTLTSQELYLGMSRALFEEFRVQGVLGWSMDRSVRMTRSRARQRETRAIDDALAIRVGIAGAF